MILQNKYLHFSVQYFSSYRYGLLSSSKLCCCLLLSSSTTACDYAAISHLTHFSIKFRCNCRNRTVSSNKYRIERQTETDIKTNLYSLSFDLVTNPNLPVPEPVPVSPLVYIRWRLWFSCTKLFWRELDLAM